MTYQTSEESLTIMGQISNEVLEREVLNVLSTMTHMQAQGLTSTVTYSTASRVASVAIRFKLLPKERE